MLPFHAKIKKNFFAKGIFNMGRTENRVLKKNFKKDIVSFFKAQHHFLPNFIDELGRIKDPRNGSYTTYDISEILYTVIMKNNCNLTSMQDMTDKFNEETIVQNICKILGKEEKEFLPHYITINECLERLDPKELEKLRIKMIRSLIRKRTFEQARFLGKYWAVIVDATGLFHFKEKHCKHCLKKTYHKGTAEEYSHYYHNVLEAKIVLGDTLILSIATEFIENEKEDVKKQDCERNAFKRLAKKIKKAFPQLPICILGDSLYACEPVFELCRENAWSYLIRYKDGSIPTLAEDYKSIKKLGEHEEIAWIEEIMHKRKARENKTHKIKWVSDISYGKQFLTVMDLKIEQEGAENQTFQWITDLKIMGKTAAEFAAMGRKRWKIENEAFNIQKNYRYDIQHANSLDYQAMKNHYLLTQLADILMQLYETGTKKLREIKRTIKNISSDLLKSLEQELTEEDIFIVKKRTSISVS